MLLALAACSTQEPAPRVQLLDAEAGIRVPGPAAELCRDLGSHVVCWGCADSPAGERICVIERSVPEPSTVSGRGWHCVGQGETRRCYDPARFSSRFECEDGRCVQHHPLLPDDGEWECIDQAGAVLCAGGDAAAGIAPAAVHASFSCGKRWGAKNERVCVAFGAEYPEGGRYRCEYRDQKRTCKKAGDVALLGDRCSAARPCVDGARCAFGVCIPPRPDPHCYIDRDCAAGVCRFGVCLERTK